MASLGAQVKNVQVNAGGNTTTNRILSPGGGSDPTAAPGDERPAMPTWAKWAGAGVLLAVVLKLSRK